MKRRFGVQGWALGLTLLCLGPSGTDGQVERQAPEVMRSPAGKAFERGDYEKAARLYEQMVAEDPSDWQAAFRAALAWHRAGDYDKSVEAHRRAAEFPEAAPTAYYNLACAYALLGRPDDAFDALEQSFAAGYQDIEGVRRDPDFAGLRDHPRFDLVLAAAETPPLTWETLAERLQTEAEFGFSGVILVERDGKIVHHEGYGLADREAGIPVTPETVFSIGSVPIDFTHVAILKLLEDGRLQRSDPISKFFPRVPDDKKEMTVAHLLDSQSGLPDFHDAPEDRDADHSWIDRDEAVRRILGAELLYPPGKGSEHSHSAWGLLAAIVEIVSGQSYAVFTRKTIYEPAGMTSTGFNGEPVPAERLAIGYSTHTDGERNAPPYWGPTSWLVLGSGGQVSTAMDLYRFQRALRSGKILGPESLRAYYGEFDGHGVATAGNRYGYFCAYSQGPRNKFFLLTNGSDAVSIPQKQKLRKLARDLFRLLDT